jgi:hypothetical protein
LWAIASVFIRLVRRALRLNSPADVLFVAE